MFKKTVKEIYYYIFKSYMNFQVFDFEINKNNYLSIYFNYNS